MHGPATGRRLLRAEVEVAQRGCLQRVLREVAYLGQRGPALHLVRIDLVSDEHCPRFAVVVRVARRVPPDREAHALVGHLEALRQLEGADRAVQDHGLVALNGVDRHASCLGAAQQLRRIDRAHEVVPLRRQPRALDIEAVPPRQFVREYDDAINVRQHTFRHLERHARAQHEVGREVGGVEFVAHRCVKYVRVNPDSDIPPLATQ